MNLIDDDPEPSLIASEPRLLGSNVAKFVVDDDATFFDGVATGGGLLSCWLVEMVTADDGDVLADVVVSAVILDVRVNGLWKQNMTIADDLLACDEPLDTCLSSSFLSYFINCLEKIYTTISSTIFFLFFMSTERR